MSNPELQKYWWKCGDGFHVGDVLQFDNGNLKGDTIFKDNRPVATIVSCNKPWYRRDYVLKIREISPGIKEGTYYQKGNRLTSVPSSLSDQ
jgi:hypothetical protein